MSPSSKDSSHKRKHCVKKAKTFFFFSLKYFSTIRKMPLFVLSIYYRHFFKQIDLNAIVQNLGRCPDLPRYPDDKAARVLCEACEGDHSPPQLPAPAHFPSTPPSLPRPLHTSHASTHLTCARLLTHCPHIVPRAALEKYYDNFRLITIEICGISENIVQITHRRSKYTCGKWTKKPKKFWGGR